MAPREQLRSVWLRYARWHLEHPEAVNLIQQCEASGILTEETRAREAEREAAGMADFAEAVRRDMLRDLLMQMFDAHFTGPVLVLAQLQEKQEIEVTDEVLRLTFEGVAQAVCWADESGHEGLGDEAAH